MTGSQRVTINGVVQSPEGVISLEAFEWAFPTVQGAASATSLSGSGTRPTNGAVGPM